MNQTEIYQGLQEIFDELFLDKVAVSPTLSAPDVAEWDSLLHISLLAAVEKRFSIRFSVGETESTDNVGEFVSLIAKHIHGR